MLSRCRFELPLLLYVNVAKEGLDDNHTMEVKIIERQTFAAQRGYSV